MSGWRYWPYVAIALGWILAAIALWWAGAWYGQMSRWDDCAVVAVGSENVYWECPSRKVRTPAPGSNGGQNA